MELLQLRSLIALSETLHFGRTARMVGRSQPSLTQQIQRLEADLGTQLVSRTKRRVALTEAGRIFLVEARAIMTHADRAAPLASQAADGEIGRLVIGMGAWTYSATLLPAVRRFVQRHPGVHLKLRAMSVEAQIGALRDERIDIAFLRPRSAIR